MTHAEAEAGITYDLGVLCRRGHKSLRYTKDSRCVECQRIRNHKRISADPERAREQNRNHVRDNPAANRARSNKWARKNREKVQAMNAQAKAARRSQPGSFTQEEWQAVLDRFGRRCLACGTSKNLSIDHVVPLALGGTNTADNLQPLCKKCNQSKGARHATDYRGGRHVAM